MLQSAGLCALAVAMTRSNYDVRASLAPETCPECRHCRTREEADRRVQEELAREYARRNGLDQDDERHLD